MSNFQVSLNTTIEETICECTHLTNFASEFLVAPNVPDFTVWENPEDLLTNPAVTVFCLGIILLYVFLAIWARRKDKFDPVKVRSNSEHFWGTLKSYRDYVDLSPVVTI